MKKEKALQEYDQQRKGVFILGFVSLPTYYLTVAQRGSLVPLR